MRLINAEDIKKRADCYPSSVRSVVANILSHTKTVKDAVKVVRCKDCKYRDGSVCDYSAVYVRPNGYCQWGERREDERTD